MIYGLKISVKESGDLSLYILSGCADTVRSRGDDLVSPGHLNGLAISY